MVFDDDMENEGIIDFGNISDDDLVFDDGDHNGDHDDDDDDDDDVTSDTLEHDSPPSILWPQELTAKKCCIQPSITSSKLSYSSSSSSSSLSSGCQTIASSSFALSGLPARDSNAEEYTEAALPDASAQPLQPNRYSAADGDSSNSSVQPGLPFCATAPSALQPDGITLGEAHQASLLYPDDPACEPRHINEVPAAELDEGAAAAHARSVSVVLLYGCEFLHTVLKHSFCQQA